MASSVQQTNPAVGPPTQDPLALLERDLLAHPTTRHYHQHHRQHPHRHHHHRRSQTGPGADKQDHSLPPNQHQFGQHLFPSSSGAAAAAADAAETHRSESRSPSCCSERSRSPSRSPASGSEPAGPPSPGAQRCMAATAAWTPRLDRRQSWDGQAYRRAMILQSNPGLTDEFLPSAEDDATDHHHPSLPAETYYAADRGFSESVRRRGSAS